MEPTGFPHDAAADALDDELLRDTLDDLAQELAASDAAEVPDVCEAGVVPPAAIPDAGSRLRSLKEMLLRIDERTRAAHSRDVAAGQSTLRLLTFSVGGRRYGVPLVNVSEIGRVPIPVPLPRVRGWLLGLTGLRGQIVSIVDLQGFLSGRQDPAEGRGRLIVVRDREGEVVIGLVVGAVHGIREFPEAQVCPVSDGADPVARGYARASCEDGDARVWVLDVDRLLMSDELRQVETG